MIALDPKDAAAVQNAVGAVRVLANSLRADTDTDTLRRDLTVVRDAIISAGETIRRAEDNVRYRIAERP